MYYALCSHNRKIYFYQNSKKIFSNHSPTFENCFTMQFKILYKVKPDFDAEAIPGPRGPGAKCFCRDKKKIFKTLCCARSFCRQWHNGECLLFFY